jgi:hypothetical protein
MDLVVKGEFNRQVIILLDEEPEEMIKKIKDYISENYGIAYNVEIKNLSAGPGLWHEVPGKNDNIMINISPY